MWFLVIVKEVAIKSCFADADRAFISKRMLFPTIKEESTTTSYRIRLRVMKLADNIELL